MAFDNDRFNAQQVILPEFLESHTVHDMMPGAYGYIDADAFIVRVDYTCWLDELAELKSEQEYGSEYIKLVCFDDGLVVDLASTYSKKSSFFREGHGPIANEAKDMTRYKYDESNLVPVVGLVITDSDLLKLDYAYKVMTGVHYVNKKTRKAAKAISNVSNSSDAIPGQKQTTD